MIAGDYEGDIQCGHRDAAPCGIEPRDTMRTLTAALIDWVVKGTPPPPSRYPTLADGTLVAGTRAATEFPEIPGTHLVDVNPVLDYDLGPQVAYNDLWGVVTRQPPAIKQVLPTLVPRVNSDGNELAGVASALHQAPLGTHFGWNVQPAGFFKGQLCGFTGGYVPFAVTRAERLKAGDLRPSLEERYGTQEGYACVVRRGAQSLVRDRLLLKEDASRVIAGASNAHLLPPASEGDAAARDVTARLCR
jgi:hypothetical protein